MAMADCPRLVSDYLTPYVTWYQTDRTVIVRIQLNDISNYYLRVDNEYLIFSAKKDGKQYYLVLHLFGPVVAEKTINMNLGREIKVHLVKALKFFPWLRLVRSKEKNSFIARSLDNIDEANSERDEVYIDEEDKIKFCNKMRALKTTEYKHRGNLLPDEVSSGETDDDEPQEVLDILYA